MTQKLTAEVIAEAMGQQSDEQPEEGTETEVSEAADSETDTPDNAEGAQSDVEPETSSEEESEAEGEASPEGTDEPPLVYFGEDLSGFTADQRREVIAMLEKRDDFIGKHLQSKAEGQGEETPAPEAPAELTDEAILEAFGIDPENPYEEQAAKVAIPLAKALEEQKGVITQLLERIELQDIEREWNSTLETLSKENGELPVSNVAVMEYAAENGIANPVDAYWRIAGPARRQVTEAMAAVKSRMAKETSKAKASSQRPAATQTEETLDLEGMNTKSATEKAARSVMEKLGLTGA